MPSPWETTRRFVPILSWAPRYRASAAHGDLLGALTAWAIVVPESVAYAQIAGVPPQNAFYAAPVALLAYAVFGSSRYLIVGATSAAAILSASTVAVVSSSSGDAVALSGMLALMAGGLLIVAGVLRLGFITNFLSAPALDGFLFGMALVIVVRQLGKIVGISTGDGDFFERLGHLLAHIGDWSATTVLVGVASIAVLLLLERFVPKIPASLVVLAVGIAVSAWADLEKHGVEIVGKIPSAVPTFNWPDVSLGQVSQLIGGCFGLALIVFAESYSISNRFAQLHGREVNPDQEMIAMGAANGAAGLFSGFAVSGSASRTAAAQAAGGRTAMTSVLAAVFVLITAAFLTPLFTKLPEPVLGAIVIVAVRGFLRVSTLRRLWRRDRSSFAISVVALIGVLAFDLLPGLIIAVALSLLLFVGRASAPRLSVLGRNQHGTWLDSEAHADAVTTPDLLVVRPDGELFFGNIDRVRKQLDGMTAPPATPRAVVLELSATYRLSLPVLESLGILHSQLAHRNCQLWLAAVRTPARAQLAADELLTKIGEDHVIESVDDALVPAGS